MTQLSIFEHLERQDALGRLGTSGGPKDKRAEGQGVSDIPQPSARSAFGGDTYSPAQDFTRLSRQLQLVFQVMKDGEWRTLGELAGIIGIPEQSASSRLRDLRKEQYGSYRVDRRHRSEAVAGLYEYRLNLHA